MPLHRPNQVGVGRGLKLVFRDFLNTINQASTRRTVDEGLRIGRTKPEVGDYIRLTDPDGEALKACCGGNRLVMTGNDSTTLRHSAHHFLQKIKNP